MHKPISSFGLATKIRNLKIQNKHKKRTKSFDQKNPNIVQSKKTCLYAVGKPMEKRFKKIKNFALTSSTQNDPKPKNIPNYDFFFRHQRWTLKLSPVFLYPLKTENVLWFSDVIRGYRKRPVAWNGLKSEIERLNSFITEVPII